ncbi:MAG: EAL domain-containing protein [Motiliproteus sp.]|nr:EAL domain-containing protein [Motiliproteus sp.]MCW9053354.1 EAL domain-containing protein [Motiliproteus sp.]
MNLNKRVMLLIVPVVLFSYLLAAIGVYAVQRQSILQFERSRIELLMTEMASAYGSYSAFADSYLFALAQSQTLASYLLEQDDRYREIAFATDLEKGLAQFQQHNSEFISFSIIDNGNQARYYFESSLAPFANIGKQQLAFAAEAYQKRSLTNNRHLQLEPDRSLIVINQMLDPRSLYVPISSQLDSALVIQLAIEPTGFDQLKQQMEERYRTPLQLSHVPTNVNSELGTSVSLAPGYYLSVEPGPDAIELQLRPLKFLLVLGLIFLSLCSVAILMGLIRRYITQPIVRLDTELAEVKDNKRSNISLIRSSDEVGRLSERFYELYDRLSIAYAKTRELAQRDILTGLPNRAFFAERAMVFLQQATEHDQKLAVLYIDLDNFKYVNDKYGHGLGDRLLQAFAAKLEKTVCSHGICADSVSSIGGNAVLARLAGDEFAAVMPVVSNEDSSNKIAERILAIFKNGFQFEQGVFPVTVSVGIAHFPDDGHTITRLISNADSAMYQAKAAGKNQIAHYSKLIAQQERRQKEIEAAIRKLNCDEEFTLNYIPIVDAADRKIIGCEALLRWHSPGLGNIGPAEFIPIAERTGLIKKIDYWVIDRAFADYPELAQIIGSVCQLSINLSSANLQEPGIDQYVISRAKHFDINNQLIELEITETFDVDRGLKHLELLQNLRDNHFRIAIDDFGAGYTSLIQLIEFPVDTVKLDRAFIDQLFQSNRHQVLPYLISLCQSQGFEVTAEGVETAAQYEQLKQAGCDNLQGYFFAKPMQIEQLSDYCAKDDLLLQARIDADTGLAGNQ